MVDNNTDYSGRIKVVSDEKETRVSIQDVRLSDEREFFCQVSGLAAGNAEGKTHLRVFGKEAHSALSCSFSYYKLLQLLSSCSAPPDAPVIEGVLTGISVTNDMLSKVSSLAL